ncbi:hypothetical protein JMA_22920 [Jeotgalibacillus malaysiensis]|uniref:Uncharacterized protein n=1 Tax=Jeotgalibacillus malaysiensis TaxID=1508404 RepID=A0A0B5AUA8_9BACL|nr:hypothetical protein JMA_22920 [Jeotgalibacillus malaysiensis]
MIIFHIISDRIMNLEEGTSKQTGSFKERIPPELKGIH